MWHYHRGLPPKPIDAFVECTSVTNIFPLRENIQNIWFRRQRTHGFPLAQFLLQAERLCLSAKGRKRIAGWMTSKPKASLREGIGLWRENVSKRWQWRKLTVRERARHIDKALLWSPGRSSHFWNIQTPPNSKKTSAISQAGCDFIALRPERNTHRPTHEHVANLGQLS
ncbi:hypothetical protein EV363DRAFT_1330847 [Boletus edulis]|nr:hypothetical protein EV363DRAFT_1330847 [Boletus edulis]